MSTKLQIDSPLDPSQMVPVPITAWIPVHRPLRFPEWPDDFEECCEQLQKGIRKLLRHLDRHCEGSATWIDDEKDVPSTVLAFSQSKYSLKEYLRFLKIHCEFKVQADEITCGDGRPVTLGDILGMAASIFASIAHDIFLLASIAYPARFHTRTGQVFIAKHPLNPIEEMPGFGRDNLYSEKQLWPTVSCKRLSAVMNWEKKVGLFRCDIATTPIQRAVACYTRLQHVSFNDAYSMLFFAMQGLEAFYCRGVGDLRRQLAEKCKLFLGQWPTSKNIVGDLYNVRSSFVHGNYPILRANPRSELSEKDQKHDEAVTDAAALAVRLLIASLHKCIDRGITSLEFDWRLRANRSALERSERGRI